MKYANINQLKQSLGPGCAALNPHIMAKVQDPVRKQVAGPSLVHSEAKPEGRKPRIAIISCRSRLLDSDNLIAGAKHLRDGIANWLRIDDADSNIEWSYGQVKVEKEFEGTIVRVIL